MKYKIEIQEKDHKIVVENSNADLPDFLRELFRAIRKTHRQTDRDWFVTATTNSITEAFKE